MGALSRAATLKIKSIAYSKMFSSGPGEEIQP